MSFPKGFLDELKARIRVSEVVGRKVKLIRRGREFVGLSPFTNEKNPSFTVNDDKQFWHCFSSGEHGDVIKFLEKTENLSFLEAVERLASEAGMEMPQRDPHHVERAREEASLIDVMEMAAAFFREKLHAGVGAEARAYLERRGLRQATIEKFGLGYAPEDRHALLRHLKAKGVDVAQMAEAGLIIAGPDIPEPYDRFRNRVMFPIADARGRTIAFGGRALDAEAKAKYLNSPETPLFHKGRGLYNLNRARKPAYDVGTVIAVEGYMDVIALAQAGFENVVAPLGTALTEDQIGLMWRMAPEPILCFDGDKAGLRAAFRAIERVLPLLKPGHSIRVALMPEGLDPDELVQKQGTQAFSEVIAQAVALPEMVFRVVISGERLETADDRARLEKKAESFVAMISDDLVKRHYTTDVRSKLWLHFKKVFGWGEYKAGKSGARHTRPDLSVVGSAREPKERKIAPGALDRELLAHMLNHPALVRRMEEVLSRIHFSQKHLQKMADEVIRLARDYGEINAETILSKVSAAGFGGEISNITSNVVFRSGSAAKERPEETVEEAIFFLLAELTRNEQLEEITADALGSFVGDDELDRFQKKVAAIRGQLTPPSMGDQHFFDLSRDLARMRKAAKRSRREAQAAFFEDLARRQRKLA